VGQLEALQAVRSLSLLAHNIEDRVNKLSSLGVVALSPVVASAALSEDKVVGAEDLAEGSSTNGVHGAGLKVDKNSTGDVLATSGLVVVHVDALQLEVRVAVVGSSGVDSVLVGNDFPELSTDLVSALAGLDVNNLTHG